MYDWFLELESGSQVWTIDQWRDITVRLGVNQPTTMRVGVLAGNPFDDLLQERIPDLLLYLDGNIHVRARLLEVEDSLRDRGHTIELGCTDYAGLLEHRFLQPPDLTTTVWLENPERAKPWDATTRYTVGNIVIDPSQAYPFQQYEAIRDVPTEAAREWSIDTSFSVGDFAVHEGRVWRCTRAYDGIREWAPTANYAINDKVLYNGRVWIANGRAAVRDYATGVTYPADSFVYDSGPTPVDPRVLFWTPTQTTQRPITQQAAGTPLPPDTPPPTNAPWRPIMLTWNYGQSRVEFWRAYVPNDDPEREPREQEYRQGAKVWHRHSGGVDLYEATRDIGFNRPPPGNGWQIIDKPNLPPTVVKPNGNYAAGSFVFHVGGLYYATKDIWAGVEPGSRNSGWQLVPIGGQNRYKFPGTRSPFWDRADPDEGAPGGIPSAHGQQWGSWTDITPARPSTDATNWKPVQNDSYRARVYGPFRGPNPGPGDAMSTGNVNPATIPRRAQTDIAWDLIEMTQSKRGGDLGITRHPNATGGKQRERTWTSVRTTLYELIDDVAHVPGGFEWWVDAERVWRVQSPVRWRDRRDVIVLSYGGSVTELRRSTPEEYWNSAVAEGSQDTTPVYVDRASPATGRWESHFRYADVIKQRTLRERAGLELDNAATIEPFYRLTLAPGVYEQNDLRPGDVTLLECQVPSRLDFVVPVRIMEIELRLDDTGVSRATLMCQAVDMEQDLVVQTSYGYRPRIDAAVALGDMFRDLRANMRRMSPGE